MKAKVEIVKDRSLNSKKKEVLKRIITAPGIAGDEDLGILNAFSDLVPSEIEVKQWPQNLCTAELNPQITTSLLVVAHADTNGLRISRINDSGFISFHVVGGIHPAHYISSIINIWSRRNKKLVQTKGLVGWKALHILEEGERKAVPEPKQLIIDIGAKNKDEVEKLGIRIGDPVTFDPCLTFLKNDLVSANGLDNRAGVWSVLESLYKLKEEKIGLHLFFAITGKEEIGLVGARQLASLQPTDFCIGIDVGHASDYPGASSLNVVNPDIKLGAGPIIYRGSTFDREMVELAIEAANKNQIPYQLVASPSMLGTDAMIFDLQGIRTIHFGIPCRYMHFQEVVSLIDLENTALLVKELIKQIDKKLVK